MIENILKAAKEAKKDLALVDTTLKNEVLLAISKALIANKDRILTANKKDLVKAQNTIKEVMLDRLRLDESRIAAMASAIKEVIELNDPLNQVLEQTKTTNGLEISKVTSAIGVIAIIYESRPNVTVDAAALAFKAGSTVILKGGKEAFYSNQVLVEIMQEVLKSFDLNPNIISFINFLEREATMELMKANGYVDLLIPRGGANLIKTVVENASVPIIETGTGNCHLYVDQTADLAMALKILDNGKCQRPSVCNSLEKLVIDEAIASQFLEMVAEWASEKKVKLYGDKLVCSYISALEADDTIYKTEFLDYTLAIKTVANIDQAIEHINRYSTMHSESIISNNEVNISKFFNLVDSACLYANASTRFSDGNQFGKGLEMGISTQKMHARGPMGLNELCSYKYLIRGKGQIRE